MIWIFLGEFCQNDYNGCGLTSACRINWDAGTICIPLDAAEQISLGKSYTCNGTCLAGYNSTDGYTCEGKNIFVFQKRSKTNHSVFRYQWMYWSYNMWKW